VIGLGFDSGGSRTTFAIDRGDGPERPPGSEIAVSLSDARGEASIEATIDWIATVIADYSDDAEVVAWIGAAGFAASTAPVLTRQFSEQLRHVRSAAESSGGNLEIFIANDGVSILKAPPLLGSGVAAIVGTGSAVLGAHPACSSGVIKRGGFEWLVSDEGSGVWMALECARRVLRDIQQRGSIGYRSILLERLADYLGVSHADTRDVPVEYQAMAKADLIARRLSEPRDDLKRFLANFVYPHLFDMAILDATASHDPIATEVLNDSVRIISDDIRTVSDSLAAHTADEPNLRERLPVLIGGHIAANPHYSQLLRNGIAEKCRFVDSVAFIGDAADELATLGRRYLESDAKQRASIARSFDPMHPVVRLL
jgi:N-acetylglucosamine kinase-like BadF-type ATPase